MQYAKLINNTLTLAPNPIIVGDRQIGNPPGEVYTAQGYKPVVYTEPPGEAYPGYMWVEKWYELNDSIYQAWEQVLVPITEENALIRYANELTGASDETLEEATETLLKIVKEEK